MLTQQCPDLQNLDLHLGLFHNFANARAGRLLQDANWRSLRMLHMEVMSCNAADLSRFLCCHPTIEDLQLCDTMPGFTWDKLVLIDDALPNLYALKCHSPTAAALLKNSKALRRLRILCGIGLDDTVEMEDYFTPDEDWFALYGGQWGDNIAASPWKAHLLDGINAHPTITSIGLDKLSMPSQLVELAGVTPSLTALSIEGGFGSNSVSGDDWLAALSNFAHLEHLDWSWALNFILDASQDVAQKLTRAFLLACPNLNIIDARGPRTVIIESATGTNLKRVKRKTKLGTVECNGSVYTAYVGKMQGNPTRLSFF
ncbi:hypothetical protein NEOLEDRAFT_1133387 [Neolentinus lepideus HHB14362 ss-1]|uniref:RNI-like protein n=1 Tax=Neolentinus lepideus HHB14362 ss-1 TaxID=1314782 RepID=A0A165SPB5_9AGAM|nr:hypothetical protein NEOLEDRAFT_1133387 [Neolentinus lepideus HHB14362 ss-1]